MRIKTLLLSLLTIISLSAVIAQAPHSIPYQAVARDSFGTPIPNQAMQARFTIRNGSSTGTIVYRETDSITTSALGIFTVVIGRGSYTVGPFDSINWARGAKYLQVEIDQTGGSSYTDLGATQLLSVPYALYANESGTGSAGNATNGLHTDGGTIKLGGLLTDSVTFVTVPYGKGIMFSPDSSVFMPDQDYTGLGIMNLNMGGDTIFGIGAAANFINIISDRFAQFGGKNSPVVVSSGIRGSAATFGEEAEVNVAVSHYGDADELLALSGLFASPYTARLHARGYLESESYSFVRVDTNKIVAATPGDIYIATNDALTHGTMAIGKDSASNKAYANLQAKDLEYQSSVSATPVRCHMLVDRVSGGYTSSIVIDTNSLQVILRKGAGFSMQPDHFAVKNTTAQDVFTVDTFGATTTKSLSTGFVNKTSAYTLTASDHTVNCTSGTFGLTLPSASGIMGRVYVLNNSGSGTITINTTSSQTIDGNGSGTLSLAQYRNYTVQSDGSNWIILSAK